MTKIINKRPSRMPSLRAFLTHFDSERIARFVRAFGVWAACRQVWIEFRKFFQLLLQTPTRKPTLTRHSTIEVAAQASVLRDNVTISVAIPVKNAGADFALLLSSITRQRGFAKIEIIVVDSGSTDQSIATAAAYGANVVRIPSEQFSHSHARNLAAECATGEYILFTVQDALPSSETWLHELFVALESNGVAAVSCAEFSREDADLFYCAGSWAHYRFLEVDVQDRLMSRPDTQDYLNLRKNAQLSNLACLMRRDLFLNYRFRGSYAEDLDLGLRLINDGHALAFLSSTKIIHSHNRPAYYYLRRGYVDALFLCRNFADCGILTIEPGHLLRDMVFVHRVVSSTINRLSRLPVPCKVRAVSDLVTDHYAGIFRRNQPVPMETSGNEDADRAFLDFLAQLRVDHDNTSVDGRYDGVLGAAMQSATGTILDYMDHTYEIVDNTVIEELKACLFKIFAFQAGIHLAACYVGGTDGSRLELDQINELLSRGV